MPYKVAKIRIDCPFLDRRTKLLPCQREMVKYWRKQGASQRELARMFSVSRRLITFVLDDDKHKRNLEARRERGGEKQYYDKDKHRETMKKHRRDKHNRLKDTI